MLSHLSPLSLSISEALDAHADNNCLILQCVDTVIRQALRYIIRNTTLPQRARAQAQLQLSQMHCYTRSTQINNRCIEGGKSRGVLKDFRMARVCFRSQLFAQWVLTFRAVSIQDECSRRKYTWCKESELVI